MNQNDATVQSGLLVDNIILSPNTGPSGVPLPAAAWAGLLGLAREDPPGVGDGHELNGLGPDPVAAAEFDRSHLNAAPGAVEHDEWVLATAVHKRDVAATTSTTSSRLSATVVELLMCSQRT